MFFFCLTDPPPPARAPAAQEGLSLAANVLGVSIEDVSFDNVRYFQGEEVPIAADLEFVLQQDAEDAQGTTGLFEKTITKSMTERSHIRDGSLLFNLHGGFQKRFWEMNERFSCGCNGSGRKIRETPALLDRRHRVWCLNYCCTFELRRLSLSLNGGIIYLLCRM